MGNVAMEIGFTAGKSWITFFLLKFISLAFRIGSTFEQAGLKTETLRSTISPAVNK